MYLVFWVYLKKQKNKQEKLGCTNTEAFLETLKGKKSVSTLQYVFEVSFTLVWGHWTLNTFLGVTCFISIVEFIGRTHSFVTQLQRHVIVNTTIKSVLWLFGEIHPVFLFFCLRHCGNNAHSASCRSDDQVWIIDEMWLQKLKFGFIFLIFFYKITSCLGSGF